MEFKIFDSKFLNKEVKLKAQGCPNNRKGA